MARPNRNDLIAIIAVAFLFAMLAYLGMTLMRASERIALLWIPNAVVAALLIRSRSDSRVYFILACAAADLAVAKRSRICRRCPVTSCFSSSMEMATSTPSPRPM